MLKKIITVLLIISIIAINIPVFAFDDPDAEMGKEELQGFIKTVGAEVKKEPTINSRHAVVYDRKTGKVLYGKKENEKCKMASTTKILTATVVIEKAKNLNEKTKVSSKAAGTGGSRLGLHKDDEITIKDLLYGLMLCSGNDAAVALAEHIGGSVEGFANLMNEKAKELKLQNTHFVTPHGLDEEEHYTTAYELAQIADYALKIEEFAKIVKTKEYTVNINGNSKNLTNTNELLGNLNGVYGVKTGFTNGANRCLVTSVKRGNMDIISVVLGADTKKDRTKDSIKIIEYAFANYNMIDMEYMLHDEFDEIVTNTKFDIIKGVNCDLEMCLGENDIHLYPIHKEAVKDLKIETELKQTFEAPVEKGEKIRQNYNKNSR